MAPLALSRTLFLTVFDLHNTERLAEWKKIRDQLETDNDPFKTVLSLWSRAPFVNSYLDTIASDQWPDPWHLILDNRYDDLALALGIMYTLKLTKRFMNEEFKIHKSMRDRESFHLIVGSIACFDIANRQLISESVLEQDAIKLVYSSKQ
jgi:hypothetical protein